MRSRLLLLGVLTLTAFSATAFAKQSSNEAAILKIEEAMTAAQNTNEAVAAWDSHVVLDDMVAIDGRTSRYVGLDAVHKDFDPQFAAISNIKTKILTMAIEADSQIGFAYSTQHLIATSKSGGPNLDIVFSETDCFHKINGRWLLIHQQLSVPFNPSTGKAVFNAQ